MKRIKKYLAIFLILQLLLITTLSEPKETDAFVPAIPFGAGAVGLGAAALGGLTVAVTGGLVGHELYNFGKNTMDFTKTYGTKLWDKAKDATVSWVGGTVDNPPDIKIDNIPTTLSTDIINYGNAVVANDIQLNRYENDPLEDYGMDNEIMYKTQFPYAQYSYKYSSSRTENELTISDANDKQFLISGPTGTFIGKSIQILNDPFGKNRLRMKNLYDLNNIDNGFRSSVLTVYSTNDLSAPSFSTNYVIPEDIFNAINVAGVTVSVISGSTADKLLDVARENFLNKKLNDAYEDLLKGGVVISGSSIIAMNPGLTWDGNVFRDKEGEIADTSTLTMPFPQVYEKDGEKRIGFPVGEGLVSNPFTGETTQTGEGAVEGDVPGSGTGTGNTSGILQGLWDWLKSILQSILDAIIALAGLLGILGLLETIIGIISAIGSGVVSIYDFLKENLLALLQSILNGILAIPSGIASIYDFLTSGLMSILQSILNGILTIAEVFTLGLVGNVNNINFSKLKSTGLLITEKFPFSLPFDIHKALLAIFGGLTEGDSPKFVFNIYNVNIPIEIPSLFDKYAMFLRGFLLVVFDIGLIYSVRKLLGGAT